MTPVQGVLIYYIANCSQNCMQTEFKQKIICPGQFKDSFYYLSHSNIKCTNIQTYYTVCQSFSLVTCAALSTPSNGRVSYNKDSLGGRYPYKTTATFTCNSGYKRDGPEFASCLNLNFKNDWSGWTPACNKKSNQKNYIIKYRTHSQRTSVKEENFATADNIKTGRL